MILSPPLGNGYSVKDAIEPTDSGIGQSLMFRDMFLEIMLVFYNLYHVGFRVCFSYFIALQKGINRAVIWPVRNDGYDMRMYIPS
jgi:hypothetical protein